MTNLFVYGTLMFPELIEALTGKRFESQKAILNGYKRHQIFDGKTPRTYPAIIVNENAFIEGLVLFNVDDASLRILDFFEDEDYLKSKVTVIASGQEVATTAYVWNTENSGQLKGNWRPENFKTNHLAQYVYKLASEVREAYIRKNS